MNSGAERVMRKRDDISRFMVHLTRDDVREWPVGEGGDASRNFQKIMEEKTIRAIKPHCLHGDRVRKLPSKLRRKFRVTCFTETPLNQIKHLIDVTGRQIDLEAYGFVFERDFLYQLDAQPAIYINDYSDSNAQRRAFDSIYEVSAKKEFTGRMWRTLPFVNIMHNGNDFVWEREWRVVGDVPFTLGDLVCVILPEYETQLRREMAAKGIAAIDPDWDHEQVVAELASQQRRTKAIWKAKVPQVPKRVGPKLARMRS